MQTIPSTTPISSDTIDGRIVRAVGCLHQAGFGDDADLALAQIMKRPDIAYRRLATFAATIGRVDLVCDIIETARPVVRHAAFEAAVDSALKKLPAPDRHRDSVILLDRFLPDGASPSQLGRLFKRNMSLVDAADLAHRIQRLDAGLDKAILSARLAILNSDEEPARRLIDTLPSDHEIRTTILEDLWRLARGEGDLPRMMHWGECLILAAPEKTEARRLSATVVAAATLDPVRIDRLVAAVHAAVAPALFLEATKATIGALAVQNFHGIAFDLLDRFGMDDDVALLQRLLSRSIALTDAQRLRAQVNRAADSVDRSVLALRLAVLFDDAAAAEQLLATIPVDHPGRTIAAKEMVGYAKAKRDDANHIRWGFELVSRDPDIAPPTLVGLLKAAATVGDMAKARRCHKRLVGRMAEIRADEALFAKKWGWLVNAALELFDIDMAIADLERSRPYHATSERAPLNEAHYLGFMRDHRSELRATKQMIVDLLHGRQVDVDDELIRIVLPEPKLMNIGKPDTEMVNLGWLAVIAEAVRQAHKAGGRVRIVPLWLADAANAQSTPPGALSYHTTGREPGLQHFKEADLPGYFSLDPAGYAGWASISECSTADLDLEAVSQREADLFTADHHATVVMANGSKYQQAERGLQQPLPTRYVFLALQVATDRVQQLARVPMLAMIDIVARRFAGTPMKVLVKRHPKCRDMLVAAKLDELAKAGQIDLRTESIHDLIPGAEAVITTNSGVGSEALAYIKPVYLFGLADYAAATHRVEGAADFYEKTEKIELPIPAETIRRFLYFYRTDFLVDWRNPSRLAEAVATRVVGPALERRAAG
jgi:hypothetical protein